MTNVFIAPRIKVGFQKRADTFTGSLGYVIYYDEKGTLRKQASWESWRDKTIEPVEYSNLPMDGFTLNRDIKRYSGEWFSSHRTMIRVHDPRGFEFEVTTENLIAILMHTDCLRRGLIGKFVYAWIGPELVLLPTNSEEFQQAQRFTAGLSKKVSAKSLVAGATYRTKKGEEVVYVGRLNWYSYSSKGYLYTGLRREEKRYVFTQDNGKSFFSKSSVEFLSEPLSTEPVSNYAEIVDKFNKKLYARKIVKYDFRLVDFKPKIQWHSNNYPYLENRVFFTRSSGSDCMSLVSIDMADRGLPIEKVAEQNPALVTVSPNNKSAFLIAGYHISDLYRYRSGDVVIHPETGELVRVEDDSKTKWPSYPYRDLPITLEAVNQQKLYHLFVVFENGEEEYISFIDQLTDPS